LRAAVDARRALAARAFIGKALRHLNAWKQRFCALAMRNAGTDVKKPPEGGSL
jgi:hypothetical protein